MASACSTSDSFDLDGRSSSEPILTYWTDGGECRARCEFRIEVFSDGRVDTSAYGTVTFTDRIDAGTLIDQIEATSRDDVVIGDADCEREAGIDAPTLEVGNDVIDFCMYEVNDDHEIVRTARQLADQIDRRVPLLDAESTRELRVDTTPRDVDPFNRSEWPASVDPAPCAPIYASNPDLNAFSDAVLAVEPTDEICNIWVFDLHGAASLCPIPRSWSGDVLVGESWFRCPGR